jgi:hypothetical protein
MTKYDGKSMAFKNGSFTFPSGSLTSVDWAETRDEIDVTGVSQEDKEFLPSERSSVVTVNAWDDSEGTIYDACETVDDAATIEFYPQGNTSGKPKKSASAFVTGRSRPVTHNQGVPITITFRVTGAVTESDVA